MERPKLGLFEIEKLDEEFLDAYTQLSAFVGGSNDNFINWIEGKKSVACAILHQYLWECREDKKRCLDLPECCDEYLNVINIEVFKKHMAYFLWEENGKKSTNPLALQQKEYFQACDYIMSFCDRLPKIGAKCKYHKLLSSIDRRQKGERRTGLDRRQLKTRKASRSTMLQNEQRTSAEQRSGMGRRVSSDRRTYDHRGEAAKYF